jgi:hypothetical protein
MTLFFNKMFLNYGGYKVILNQAKFKKITYAIALAMAALSMPVLAEKMDQTTPNEAVGIAVPASIKKMGSLRICADPGNMPLTND